MKSGRCGGSIRVYGNKTSGGEMKKYTYALALIVGVSAAFLPIKHNTTKTIQSSKLLIDNKYEIEFRSLNQNKGETHEQNTQTTPETECFGSCFGRVISALISGDPLTHLEKRSLTTNPEFLAHYLKYNPQYIIDVAHFITDHTTEYLDDLGYDEFLEARVDILENVITRIPIDDLRSIASTLVYSDKKNQRAAGLMLLERAYIDRSEVDTQDKKAAMMHVLRNLAATEIDPQLQLRAISIISYETPEHVNEQTISILTDLATGNQPAQIKGNALKMAAYFAKPDSAVISQIALELNDPASQIQLPALIALQTIYSKSRVDNAEMLVRLHQLQPALEAYMRQPMTDGEARRLAEGFLYKGGEYGDR